MGAFDDMLKTLLCNILMHRVKSFKIQNIPKIFCVIAKTQRYTKRNWYKEDDPTCFLNQLIRVALSLAQSDIPHWAKHRSDQSRIKRRLPRLHRALQHATYAPF